MIKKLLSLYFTGVIGIAASFGQATCSPNLSCIPTGETSGICPDSATGIPGGVLNTAYSTNMSIMIPSSYTSGTTTYNFSHFAVTEVTVDTSAAHSGTYVPLSAIGLTYLGNGLNTLGSSNIGSYTMTNYCYWAAPGSACVIVSGTPTKSGNFPVRIKSQIRAFVVAFYTWIPAPDNNDYKIVVSPTAGIETIDLTKFDVKQNVPNPFNSISEITYSSLNSNEVDFKVYNMLGKVVMNKTVKAEKGSNTIEVDASSFSPGIYVYSIKNGDKTITKRMIVSNK
jgi:hypothetical protein